MVPQPSFNGVTAYFESSADCRHPMQDFLHAGLSKADLTMDDERSSSQPSPGGTVGDSGTIWDVLTEFFRADVKSEVYDKESLGPVFSSCRVSLSRRLRL